MAPHNSPELAVDVWRYTAQNLSERNTYTVRVREPGTNRLVFESAVELTDPSSTRVEYTLTDVWTGDYDIYLYNFPFLSRVQQNVHLVAGQETVLDFSARGEYGDLNGDDEINYIDLGSLGTRYNQIYWLYDLDGNGFMNYVELGALGSNYNHVGKDCHERCMLPTNVKPTALQLAEGLDNPVATTSGVTALLSPSSGTYAVGSQFDVAVFVDTGGNAIRGSNIAVRYDSYALKVVSVTDGGLFPDGTANSNTTPEKGEISMLNTNISATFNGAGTLFTVRFQVTAGGTNSGVWVYLQPDATNDSNVVSYSENTDLLAAAGYGMYSLTGSPARPGTSGTLIPGSGVYITSYELPVELTLDANSSMIADSVLFEAYYDNAWHALFDDDNKNGGWGLNWDTLSVPDQVIWLRATVSDINDGSYSVESSAIMLDRIPPSTDLSVSVNSNDHEATIAWISADNLSGVSQVGIQYKVGRDGDWQLLSVGSAIGSVQLSMTDGEVYYVRVRAVDQAGNWSQYSKERLIAKVVYMPCVMSR